MNIIPFSIEHLSDVKKICDEQFGIDYLSLNYLEQFCSKENFGLVALENKVVIGLTFIRLGYRNEIEKEFLDGHDFLGKFFLSSDRLALRKHLAVKKGLEGSGIGRLLVEKGMELLEKSDVNAILSIVWKEGASEALHKLLAEFGSKPLITFENYWAADSLEKSYLCPGCKTLPCCCSAVLYAKLLKR
jgi:ribosomal protein S18 acetylase RimI-like enzyme